MRGVGQLTALRPIEKLRVSSYSRAPSDIERSYYGKLVARLAQRRNELQWTQEFLDHKLGVTEGLVAKWESFTRLPGAFMLMCWCNALHLSLVAIDYEITNYEGQKRQ